MLHERRLTRGDGPVALPQLRRSGDRVGLVSDQAEKLLVGDRVRVFGSYDYEDTWIDDAPDGYLGRVESFMPGQNEAPAAVVQLEREIVVDVPRDNGRLSARGRYVVLELAYVGAEWVRAADRVHVELCETPPEPTRWQDRAQGAWIESHAQYEKVEER
jgi:hypothetical protein